MNTLYKKILVGDSGHNVTVVTMVSRVCDFTQSLSPSKEFKGTVQPFERWFLRRILKKLSIIQDQQT